MSSRVNGMNRRPFLTLFGNRNERLWRAVFHVPVPTAFGVNLSNHFNIPHRNCPQV